ncbi:hypothetical protein EES46_13835 [Streptomyces sp. ADI98-10]|nr:hypothetical protein EES46_13835 [Streptomyces sp. ADI98-10]
MASDLGFSITCSGRHLFDDASCGVRGDSGACCEGCLTCGFVVRVGRSTCFPPWSGSSARLGPRTLLNCEFIRKSLASATPSGARSETLDARSGSLNLTGLSGSGPAGRVLSQGGSNPLSPGPPRLSRARGRCSSAPPERAGRPRRQGNGNSPGAQRQRPRRMRRAAKSCAPPANRQDSLPVPSPRLGQDHAGGRCWPSRTTDGDASRGRRPSVLPTARRLGGPRIHCGDPGPSTMSSWKGEPHRRPSSVRPFVRGRSRQVRVQRWLLPFEQE